MDGPFPGHPVRPTSVSLLHNPLSHVGDHHPFSTGDQRLRLPESLPPYEGNYEAHKYGPSCPQQRMLLPQGLDTRLEKDVNNIVAMMYEAVTEDSEDCKVSCPCV